MATGLAWFSSRHLGLPEERQGSDRSTVDLAVRKVMADEREGAGHWPTTPAVARP